MTEEIVIKSDEEISQSILENETSADAGQAAKKKLEKRKQKTLAAKARGVATYLSYFVIVAFLLSGVKAYYWYQDVRPIGYHYKRTCSLPEDAGMEILGERTYLNQAREVLGMKLVDANKASEKTTLRSTHLETTITGITGKDWWSVHNPAAEPRVVNLKEADFYVFTQGTKTFVIGYDEFCK